MINFGTTHCPKKASAIYLADVSEIIVIEEGFIIKTLVQIYKKANNGPTLSKI